MSYYNNKTWWRNIIIQVFICTHNLKNNVKYLFSLFPAVKINNQPLVIILQEMIIAQ